jgi:CHASE2 domain-containing sensor protein
MADDLPPREDADFGEHAAAILSTEHWSLLSSRSLTYTESFNRVTVFLTILSSSIVSLALVANTTGLDEEFTWAAVLLVPLVLFVGITTYVRLVQLNLDDAFTMVAMNRLRHAYVEIEPRLDRYLMSGWHDDERGVLKSMLLARSTMPRDRWHSLVTTPTVIAIISSFVGAAGAGFILARSGLSAPLSVAIAAAVMLLMSAALLRYQVRSTHQLGLVDPQFPSPSEAATRS